MDQELKDRIITYVTQNNLRWGEYPSFDQLLSEFGLGPKVLIDGLTDETWIPAWETRFGINPVQFYGLEQLVSAEKPKAKKGPDELDPLWVLACSIILDGTDKRSTAAKLKAIGMSSAKWEAFNRRPQYKAFYEEALGRQFGQAENSAKLSLIRNIESGDLASIKHYQEYTGKFRPNSELTMNLGFIIAQLMEVLSRKLSSEDLIEVSESFDTILKPQKELGA